MSVPLVRVVRSGVEESVHEGDVAVADAEGRAVTWAGDHERVVFARSALKPVQAAVSMSLAGLPFTDREVAVMCGSHAAEWLHLEAVRTILARAGLEEIDLRCPPARSRDEETLALDPEPRRMHHNCSGKHAAMLAACTAREWPVASYVEPNHPLQERVLTTVREASGADDVAVGTDGCGLPTHALSLRALATMFARLLAPDRLGDLAPHAERAVGAMRAHPRLVAGRGRPDTLLMETVPGLATKGGAEGIACAAVPGLGFGIAVKIRDGAPRAAAPALVAVLRALGALDEDQAERLAPVASPAVLGGASPVGTLEPVRVALEHAASR